ncbi:MAG: hypothetical protein FWD66_11320 [Paludibacter sp.]|nr:hypothetical protein [Paludibacter sp.]
MKTTKILMATFLMSIFCVALSYGQQDQKTKMTPEARAAKRIEKMKTSLNLTDEQVTKVQAAQAQLVSDMKQVRDKSQANRDEMKAKRDAYDAQMKTILTQEQYQKYQEQRKDMQNNMRQRMQKRNQGEHSRGAQPAKDQDKS